MNTKEQNFWSSLRRSLPHDIWAQRVENGLVPGMPDVYLKAKREGRQAWLELKVAQAPVRRTTPWLKREDIRLAQLNWHIKAYAFDIPTFIGLRCNHDDGSQTIHLVPGRLVTEVHAYDANDWAHWRHDSYSSFWEEFR